MTLLNNILPEARRGLLKKALNSGGLVRIIEAHNGLSGIVANDVKVQGLDEDNPIAREFDGIWESSLTDSASKGHPDIEIVSFDSRLQSIHEILAVTSKPMIVDGDTGGEPNNFEYAVTKLERAGVSAVIIEDKVFPKRNSLEAGTSQEQETPENFAHKIRRGKAVQKSCDFMIIARIESLIAEAGMDDAKQRARVYLEAGVDGIMIHSKQKSPDEIFEFAVFYKELQKDMNILKPLICVPTTYNSVHEEELRLAGFDIVIYANHLLRAAYQSMLETAKTILVNQRSFEADPLCAPVREIFKTVGFLDVKEKDKQEEALRANSVIIPAAGEDEVLKPMLNGKPKAMLNISGKTILDRQISTLNSNGLSDITVVTGYAGDQLKANNIHKIHNSAYAQGTVLHSLVSARSKMENGFIMLYSDILLEEHILSPLLRCQEDIVLVVDNAIQYHRYEEGKVVDFLVSRNKSSKGKRKIRFMYENSILKISDKIDPTEATHEFIGLAKFSKNGAENFLQTFEECSQNSGGNIRESGGFDLFSFTDLIQEMINRGFPVHFFEIHQGWLEIHDEKDVALANDMF
jgi:phosphoenolpyruvate phosphomutase